MALILDLRRMGKSSLLRSFLNGYGIPHILIDARRIVINESRMNTRGFMNELSQALTEFLRRKSSVRDGLLDVLHSINEVTIGTSPLNVSISWRRGRTVLTALLDAVDRAAEELGEKVVLAIDEVQDIISPRLPALLSVAYNESRVRFIFGGSLVGTTRLIMRNLEPLGRPLIRFELKPFAREQSMEFLRLGSRNCGVNISDTEIEDAVNEFNGIVGWLTYYGSLRASDKGHLETMEALKDIAREIIKNELSKLGKYEVVIYRALATLGRARWIEIKRPTESLIGRLIDDETFTTALRALVNMYMIREVEHGI